ncbi:glycerophosphodiester phosphodiesterase family protein [Qiania dongpingensis]|uniref:Glycerophosphodiester phosphodiesterase n=1 Tax=Qiania dongpingensis TaxID=2763669 RepID=A0A7G9G6J0_9FIRM|nr:glycerophosphodiester phosphodiesterase family protein [Qiania dongpingensis]QNM06422.1 glycerophosphodiester phosphodiesterase [Qiania dongpingensis]
MTILLILLILVLVCVVLSLLYLYLIMPALGHKGDIASLTGYYYAHRGLHDMSTMPGRKSGIQKEKTFKSRKKRKAAAASSDRQTSVSEARPENSMAAFRAAVEAGYGIELDVQLTKDNIPVVFHDYSLERVCHVPGEIKDFTYEELKEFTLNGTTERIPRFEDVLNMVNGRIPLLIEYKVERFDTSVCTICDELLGTYPGLYFIESFNPLVLRWYKKNRPQIVRGQLSAKFKNDNLFMHYFFLSPLHHLLFNFLTKPDFIAYDCTCADAVSRRICRNLYKNLAVAWTIRSKEDMEQFKAQFDLFIFEGFRP